MVAQVGINTTNPRATLEIAGDTNITGTIDIGDISSLTDGEQSTFLIQDSDNSIKSIDVSNPTGAALGYIQEYEIINPDKDWVKDFDTGIDASDYVLIAISASFDQELIISDSHNAPDNATLPYTSTFVKNGTWHIIADFPVAANTAGTIGTWNIQTLIYSNDLSKQFGTVVIPMLGGTTSSAVVPIID
ncbi:hypothetical protein KXJ69_13420 [Aureisphaera sp. CAU 1614]|uniref:Uncharacterized protein n=1 Tax=Halomarinibacterium sedimenti TaxID=2857106 RepID=A0A9X1JWQ1_9FLAO|nr:hypothetical protein [Halomarinibacterium sedimenti]MBW2939110.1 hypothetical protein [Halomarinibacterium sedimenti]